MSAVLNTFGEAAMVGKSTLEQFFYELDHDGRGTICREEFIQGMLRFGRFETGEFTPKQRMEQVASINKFFNEMDKDDSGFLDYKELLSVVGQYKFRFFAMNQLATAVKKNRLFKSRKLTSWAG